MTISAHDSYELIASLVERNADVPAGMNELYELCRSAFPSVTFDLREFERIVWSWQEVSAWARRLDKAGAWAACGIPIRSWTFEIAELAGENGSTIPAIDLVGGQWTNYWTSGENRDLQIFVPDGHLITPATMTRLWQMIDHVTDVKAHDLFEYALPLGYVALTAAALMREQNLPMFHGMYVYAAWGGGDAVLIQPTGVVLEVPQPCEEEMERVRALADADAEEFMERFLRQQSDSS